VPHSVVEQDCDLAGRGGHCLGLADAGRESSVKGAERGVSEPQHAMLHGSSRPGLNYRDAWLLAQPDRPRAPTCGIHDHVQWPNGADCRDFIFVTQDLSSRVRRVSVDAVTAASDHQPVLIEMSA
jgi:exonuclease III